MSTLNGRSAIVTGAAQGLGRAFAAALVRAGANVTLCDVQPSVAEVAGALTGPGKAIGVVATSRRTRTWRGSSTARSRASGASTRS